MRTFQQDLQEAISYHGHLCSGQILGVRMARTALERLGIDDPKEFRDLIVYVECDRCLTDAIGTVTGCKLGKRNLKWMDYGKTAATFLNLQTGEGIRLYRKKRVYPADGEDLVAFFDAIPDEDLFSVTRVKVRYRPEDLPGKPLDAMTCPKCGEEVIDGRQVIQDGVSVCKACAEGAYYDWEAGS
ncbi:MAG: FmdE family protein [Gracilibacteraceae bacterium]|jgi:formylmethanofuran dehydrogenase subunit E|nr:FmdE family protein [Gracilibacteraceae bacterium]